MSKHETALALLDEQIEKLTADKQKAHGATLLARGSLERAEKDEKFIEWSLAQVEQSKAALLKDRAVSAMAAVSITAAKSGDGHFA